MFIIVFNVFCDILQKGIQSYNINSMIFTLHCVSCVSAIFRHNKNLYGALFKTYNIKIIEN